MEAARYICIIQKITVSDIQQEKETSLDLKYVRTTQHLEGGFDSGNMCSLVVAQEQLPFIRGLKEFYTLPEDFINELEESNEIAEEIKKMTCL